jgi:hypothetical protein
MQLCYIVPADAPAALLDAVFAECYTRWGGRDTLIISYRDGVIDEKYWVWAKALDPDVVYTYVPLDDALLDRLDRDLMPSSVESHRRDNDWRPLFREAPEGLQALALTAPEEHAAMGNTASARAADDVHAHPHDAFIADSFGLAHTDRGGPFMTKCGATQNQLRSATLARSIWERRQAKTCRIAVHYFHC